MTVLVRQTPAYRQPRAGADAAARSRRVRTRIKNADAVLAIGLVNNMPDPALQATERQFTRLLQAAAGNRRIHLHCFSLPSVKRSPQAKALMEGRYTDIADLGRLQLDGLIVTGAEPIAATLPEEPFWKDLTDVIDWAETNTRSAIWSCLAAHAAVLHLDGIERQRLDVKCSGIYDCAKVTDDWLMKDITSPLKIAHSRINALRKRDLTAHGYQLLTESPRRRRRHLRQAVAQPFCLLPGPSGIRRTVAAAGISARHHPLSGAPARYFSGVARRAISTPRPNASSPTIRSGRSQSARFRSASNFRTSRFVPISQPASPRGDLPELARISFR